MPQEWEDKPVKYLRDNVVEQLKWNLAQDHLDVEEFEQLVAVAFSTQSKSELLALTRDLPTPQHTAVQPIEQELALYKETKSLVTVLAESRKSGLWALPKNLRVVTALAETTLDFRGMRPGQEVKYISLNCYLGATKIVVPPGVNVVSQVKTILGSVDDESRGRIDPNAATLIIEGTVLLGELTIDVEP